MEKITLKRIESQAKMNILDHAEENDLISDELRDRYEDCDERIDIAIETGYFDCDEFFKLIEDNTSEIQRIVKKKTEVYKNLGVYSE